MALSQSVLSELLDAFRAGDGVDLVRDAVRLVLQELIEVEAAEQIGAQRYERTETPGSPSPRSAGSVPGWTRSLARSAPAGSITSSSPTSTSMRPTSTSATPRRRSCRWP